MQGILFDIKRFALHDGPGIRTTIFLKGCPMKCWWCHNPESLSPGASDGFGEKKTIQQVMKEIEKEIIFYDESGGGVTFSGGEPLVQPEFLEILVDECKEREIHTALDTTGCVPPRVFNLLMEKIDLFLYDVKIMDHSKHMEYTGTSNKYTLENLKNLSLEGKKVIIRFPLIPGITDTDKNITATATFVSSLKGIQKIDVLPYHRIAEKKYRRLKIENKMKGVKPPSTERIEAVKKKFERYGLKVKEEWQTKNE